jgi:lysozyme family protein
MRQGLKLVHLRTVPDAWQARVLAARLGAEGIMTHLKGNLAGPYPFGAVSVLVVEDQAEAAAELLLVDEVEAAFSGALEATEEGGPLAEGLGLRCPGRGRSFTWKRAAAAAAVVCVAGAPLLAHFVGS